VGGGGGWVPTHYHVTPNSCWGWIEVEVELGCDNIFGQFINNQEHPPAQPRSEEKNFQNFGKMKAMSKTYFHSFDLSGFWKTVLMEGVLKSLLVSKISIFHNLILPSSVPAPAQLDWVSLNITSRPASQPPSHPPTRNSFKFNSNVNQIIQTRFTQLKMEDYLNLFVNGRRPQLFVNGRQPQLVSKWKMTSTFLWLEGDLNCVNVRQIILLVNGRQLFFYVKGRQPQSFNLKRKMTFFLPSKSSLVSLAKPELGTALPQLVYIF
jgi:hypothetical protein